MSSLCSSLSHILCIHLHVLPAFLEDLQQLFLKVVVPCSAHVQAFYVTVHLVLLSHEPNLVLVGPLLRREIPMAWGTTTDSLTLEINPFQYAIEIKYLTLKDQTLYVLPDG